MLQLSTVQTSLEEMSADQRWNAYIGWLHGFDSFIDEAIQVMAIAVQTDSAKAEKHRGAMATAFEVMDDWYYGRKPVVKAHRNNIDSAVSFLRNTALQNGVRSMPGAACARNLAGALRSAVYLSIHGYEPQDYPQVITNSFFNMAVVRALLPADTSDFVQFLKPGENIMPGTQNGQPIAADINNLLVMVERGCKQLGMPAAYKRLQEELGHIYQHLQHPQVWAVPSGLWQPHDHSPLSDVHYKAQARFLSKK